MTLRSEIGRRGPAVAVMAAGALVTIVGTWLPWVRSGSALRNSYDVFALIDRLGFSSGELVGRGLRLWPLVPLLVIGAAVLAWWGWAGAGAAVGVVGAVYAGGVALAVITADAPAVEIRPGATVTVAGSVVLLLGSIGVVVLAARRAS